MLTAVEEFARHLARASRQGSRHLRGLSRADADDALAQTLAWCWEHRDEFDPTKGPLGAWFAERLKWNVRTLRTTNRREAARRARQTLEEAERVQSFTRPSGSSDERHYTSVRSGIDHEIERLLQSPKYERADCPVCWRCMWFAGYARPKNYKPRVFSDKELQSAVIATEERKHLIARGEF